MIPHKNIDGTYHPIMVAYFKGTTVAKTVDLYHLLLKLELA